MFQVEYEYKNKIRPWMVLGESNWVYCTGAAVSIAIFSWAIVKSLMKRDWLFSAIIGIYFLVFIWMILRSIKVDRTIISKFGSDDWTRKVLFQDEEIVVTETGSKGAYTERRRYGEIAQILENGERITLKMTTLPNIAFSKDEFTLGDWADCKGFLEEARGKERERI